MFCNYCGAPNPDDAAFCSACGKRVAHLDAPSTAAPSQPLPAPQPPPRGDVSPPAIADSASSAAPAPTRRSAGAMLAWVTLLLLIGAIGAGVALELSKPTEDPPLTSTSTEPSTSVPVTTTASSTIPETTSVADPAPPPAATAPEPAPAPASPPTIVGEWKTSLILGEGTLTLTADGHCHVKNVMADDTGIYTYSPSDGELRIQVDSFFNHDIITWHAQLSADGESLTVLEPEGAAHVYKRVHD